MAVGNGIMLKMFLDRINKINRIAGKVLNPVNPV